MTRTARLEELGLPLHIIVQGHGRRPIVRDAIDRERLIRRAARVFAEEGLIVLAWALLDNHIHLIVIATLRRLARPMQRWLGPYAWEFNGRHGFVGRLVRDRFFSRPVEDDDDLLNLIAYVLLNPIRAGAATSLQALQEYRWSSLSELCYPERHRRPLVTPSAVLPLFAKERHRAVNALLEMLAGRLRDDPAGLSAAVLGAEPGEVGTLSERESQELESDCTFALMIRTERIDGVLRDRQARTSIRLRLEARGWNLSHAAARACEITGARRCALATGSRRRPVSRARALVAHFASGYLGASYLEIAQRVGVSRQAIGRCRDRGAALAERLSLDAARFFRLSHQDDACDL